jgi:hypothetical protein
LKIADCRLGEGRRLKMSDMTIERYWLFNLQSEIFNLQSPQRQVIPGPRDCFVGM